MIRDWGPGPRGALALAGVAALLFGLAWLQGAPLAGNLAYVALVLLVAAGLGYLLGVTPGSLAQGPWRDVVLAAGLALAGVVLVLAWGRLEARFTAPEWAWLRYLGAGLAVLPALLPAAILRRLGAALTGLAVQSLAVAFSGVLYGALVLLAVPLIAAPVELWLLYRRHDGRALTMGVAGLTLGALNGLVARSYLLDAAGPWPLAGAVAGAAAGGAVCGFLTAALAARLGPRLGLPAGPPAETP